MGGLFLTAGADVQKDRIEVSIWAWGRGLESWLVDHVVIDGGPGDAASWDHLSALLGETWPHAAGTRLGLARLAIDTGYETPAVYAWARRQGASQVLPVKGVEGFNRASPVSGPTFVDATAGGKRLRRGARLWTVATSTFKAETYRFLRLARPTPEELADGAAFPPGTVHLPGWPDTEWIRQLTAEQLVTVRNRRGFAKLEWQKLRERNEALDTRVYARAAAWITRSRKAGSSSMSPRQRLMLLATVSLKRKTSCGTYPMLDRRTSRGIRRTSCPSISTVPWSGSSSRGIISTSVLLPEPVRPTIASVEPAGTSKSMPSSVHRRSWPSCSGCSGSSVS